MSAVLHRLSIPADILRRGFWLYVWAIHLKRGRIVYYVGRTGDASSPNAQSPFARVSGHLGPNSKANALRRHLAKHEIDFEACVSLDIVAYGPIYTEASEWTEHVLRRDAMHALERDLCNAMRAAKYDVLNEVSCKLPSDPKTWSVIRQEFAKHFEKLTPA
jgi:hypothetical protein